MTPKILLVDDRPENLFSLSKVLEPLTAEIVEASCGNDALTATLNHDFALILMDVQMPDMDGFEVAEYLRMSDSTREVPIIFVTANSRTVADERRGYDSGAVDFICKPVDERVLLSKVRVFLDLYRNKRQLADQNRQLQKQLEGDGTALMRNRPQTLAGYSIVRVVGRGNVGTVYLAERELRGKRQQFALKVLRNALSEFDQEELEKRFLREAEAASQVHCPQVVSVVDYGVAEDDPVPYIVMEYIEGESLKQLMAWRALTVDEAIAFLLQLTKALVAIHHCGICHRDIKPENVMVIEEKQVKITDFGIAKLPDSQLTQTSRLMGTLPYMAPESFRSSQVGTQADLFALGVIGYEMICGQRPFQADSLIDYGKAITQELPITPREFAPALPPAVEQILAKLLKKSTDERYATATDVQRDLERVNIGSVVFSRWRKGFRQETGTDWRTTTCPS